MTEMLEYFSEQYSKLQLNGYRPLDLSEIKKRVAEHGENT